MNEHHTHHYFAVYWDSETGQLHFDAEFAVNGRGSNIWDVKEQDWVFGEEYEPADQFALEALLEAFRRWNEGE